VVVHVRDHRRSGRQHAPVGQFERLGAEAVLRKPYGMTEIEQLLVGA